VELPPPPPLRPRSVGDILQAAFQLYARHWRTLLQLVAVVVVPLTLVQYLIGEQLPEGTVEVRDNTLVVTRGFWATLVAGLVFAAITVLMTQVLTGAIAWAVARILVGREPDVGECYRFGYARLWSILLVGVLTALAVMAGFILLVIPGLIVLTRLVCSIPALVVERRRGSRALGRSWDLVRGFGWPVFGAMVVTALLTGLVSGILTAPVGNSGWFVRAILAAIGSVITTPFTALVVGLIYFDLRVRKERLDVATLERELEAAGR
jgi:hypothetical protein